MHRLMWSVCLIHGTLWIGATERNLWTAEKEGQLFIEHNWELYRLDASERANRVKVREN